MRSIQRLLFVISLLSSVAVGSNTSAEVVSKILSDAGSRLPSMIVDEIASLGEEAIYAIEELAIAGVETPTLAAGLVAMGTPKAEESFLRIMQNECDSSTHSSNLGDLFTLARKARILAARPPAANVLSQFADSDVSDPHELAIAITAAELLVEFGSEKEKADACGFLLRLLEEGGAKFQSPFRQPLLIATASLVEENNLALRTIIEEIQQGIYPPEDMFRNLPRHSSSKELAVAIYDALRSTPGEYASIDVATEWAMIEALSELPVAKEVVLPSFWQEHWDRRKFDLTRPAWTTQHPAPNRVTEGLLTDGQRELLRELNVNIAP